jgi:hypothetical protein
MARKYAARRSLERELRKAIWAGLLVDLRSGDATEDDPANGLPVL